MIILGQYLPQTVLCLPANVTVRIDRGIVHSSEGGSCVTHETVDAMLNLPDEVLVLRRDEPQAVRILLDRYRKMVAGMANSYAQNYADAEDYAQEGLLGLLAAVSTYSETRAAGFRTYAAVCIRNRIRSAAKRQFRSLGGRIPEALSLDDPGNDLLETLADQAETPEQVFLEKERVSELFAQLSSVLTTQEASVLTLSASGFSYREIAEKLHISTKSVDNAVQRARRKLRAVWS